MLPLVTLLGTCRHRLDMLARKWRLAQVSRLHFSLSDLFHGVLDCSGFLCVDKTCYISEQLPGKKT